MIVIIINNGYAITRWISANSGFASVIILQIFVIIANFVDFLNNNLSEHKDRTSHKAITSLINNIQYTNIWRDTRISSKA